MTFDWLCALSSCGSRVNDLTEQQLSTLFRVSEDEQAGPIENLFTTAIDYELPLTGPEQRFHCTYDTSITRIIESILLETDVIRNSDRNMNTALQRPDFGLVLNTHCILRGEETGSNTSDNPEQDLRLKLRWQHDPLQYLLGLL